MADGNSRQKRLPIRQGRFAVPEEPGSAPYFLASRCGNCGKYFTPPRVVCLNCGKQEMEPAGLSGKGSLYTFTTVWQQLPNALVKPPYSIVIVVMDEGCQIHGVVTEDPEDLRIGEEMEAYFEKTREDEEGNDLIVDKFRPARKGRRATSRREP